ncbi:outer membrane assembly lipoprotein YfiO [Burkholderia stabilis]|nr:outer membrane assembly lipoprotein YfiO [Burkholderia stabilis]
MPMLSPANDTRINAMLMMVDSSKVAQVFPDPKTIPAKDRINQIVVPFPLDFSGWIDIGQKQPDKTGGAADADAPSNRYADGEGSICRSMNAGADAFNDALNGASGVPADEAARLRAARVDIAQKTCAAGGASAAWTKPPVKSPLGQQLAAYLDGANAFYRADFLTATKAFANASHSANPWLKETGLYMVGRAQLNAAQANVFDNDSPSPSRARVTKVSLDAANTVFRTYLKVYPQGRYATSATGLLRRVAWLGGNVTQQADLYGHALARWSPATSNVPLMQLANELDSKLLFGSELDAAQIQSPTVLATVDLLRMRTSDSSNSSRSKPLTLDDLQAQKPRFANAPALYDYLLATWYVQIGHKPDAALELLPQTPAAPLDYFGLSQQALRAFALEDSGQTDKARQLWRDLIPLAKFRFQREALELALAINLEQAGLVNDAFADDSPVQNAALRAILLQRSASADLLRAQAQNPAAGGALRDTALYTLLYKELTRSHYADFLADAALVSGTPADPLKPFIAPGARNEDGYTCPSARDIATTLQQNPGDAKGLNCLADFARLHPPAAGLESDPVPLWIRYASSTTAARVPPTLGAAPSQFAGKPYERMSSYVTVMADAQANPNDRAYALYRAIKCYAPGGSNECGGKDVPKNTRKRWFDTLKASYPGSPWAQKLRYYW